MKKIFRMISLGLAACLLALGICSCDPPDTKDDEQKIRDRVNTFADAINDRDVDAAVACLDARNRTLIKAALSMLEGDLIGSLFNIDINAEDLLTMALGVDSGDLFSAEIKDVEITSETTASVLVEVTTQAVEGVGTVNLTVDLVKERNDWYICFAVDWASLLGPYLPAELLGNR